MTITGFLSWVCGASLRKESAIAGPTSFESKRLKDVRTTFSRPSVNRVELQMLDDRTERERRHISQSAHQHHRADQQGDEQRSRVGSVPAVGSMRFFLARDPAIASTGTMKAKRPNHITTASKEL